MKFLVYVVVAALVMTLAACANGAGSEDQTPTASIEEVVTPTPVASSVSASPTPETTETSLPTPLPADPWDKCLGIVEEEGSQLIVVGDQFCVVGSELSTQVAIWPTSLEDAPEVAQRAAQELDAPCDENVVYFFANLPDLEFPKISVKDYVCN